MRLIKKIGAIRSVVLVLLLLAAVYIYAAALRYSPEEAIRGLFKENIIFQSLYLLLLFSLLSRMIVLFKGGFLKRYASILMTGGLLLLLSGLILSVTFRKEIAIVGYEGEMTEIGKINSIKTDLPEKILIIGKEKPQTISTVKAMLILDDGREAVIKAFPFRYLKGGFVVISEVGLSPDLMLSMDGLNIRRRYMRLLPPGTEYNCRLSDRYSLTVSLSPVKTFRKGRLAAMEYSLKEPPFRIVLKENNRGVVFDKVLKGGDAIREKGLNIRLSEGRWWVKLIRIGEPFFLLVYIGGGLAIIGAIIYPFQLFRLFND